MGTEFSGDDLCGNEIPLKNEKDKEFEKIEDGIRKGIGGWLSKGSTNKGANFNLVHVKIALKMANIKLNEEKIRLAITMTKVQHESGEARKIFDQFDENKDEKIDLMELKKGYDSLNKKYKDKEVELLMKQIDFDRDGAIAYNEWLILILIGNAKLLVDGNYEHMIDTNIRMKIMKAVDENSGEIDAKKFHKVILILGQVKTFSEVKKAMETHKKKEEEFKKLFKIFDTNSDGLIGREELRKGYEKLGKTWEKGELERTMIRLDTNRDGWLDWKEFNVLMLIRAIKEMQ